jgi:hypothetical protein
MAANCVLGASLAPVASARMNVRGRAAVAPLQSSLAGAKLSSRGEATAELCAGKAAAPAGRATLEVRRKLRRQRVAACAPPRAPRQAGRRKAHKRGFWGRG